MHYTVIMRCGGGVADGCMGRLKVCNKIKTLLNIFGNNITKVINLGRNNMK